MTKTEIVKTQCKQLRLPTIANAVNEVVMKAEKEKITYLEFLNRLLNSEISQRMEKDKERRQKYARLPLSYNLDLYDFTSDNSISPQELKQLREFLFWKNLYPIKPKPHSQNPVRCSCGFSCKNQEYHQQHF